MPELPAEAAIRADERARIVAWLRELVGDVPRLVEWLRERDLHAGAGPLTVLRVAADAIVRGAGVGSPASCPSAAPESTQSPETTSVAPVYPPDSVNPAGSLSAPHGEDAHPLASSQGSEHADLRRRYADALSRSLTPQRGMADHLDAVLAVRDDELAQLRESVEDLNDLIRQERAIHIETIRLAEQAEAANTRAREALASAIATWQPEYEYRRERAERKGYAHDEAVAEAYGSVIRALTPILAALDGPAAASEEQAERTRLLTLIRDLTDPDPCWFDHHGGCQAHGYLSLEPGERCPHAEAKELLSTEEQIDA